MPGNGLCQGSLQLGVDVVVGVGSRSVRVRRVSGSAAVCTWDESERRGGDRSERGAIYLSLTPSAHSHRSPADPNELIGPPADHRALDVCALVVSRVTLYILVQVR